MKLQELINLNESIHINDEDYYVVDKTTKKLLTNLGRKRVANQFRDNPHLDPELSKHIKSDNQTILKGMRAKFQGYK